MRGVLKHTVRVVGTQTARWRPLPDFLIIGSKRGGSTSIYFDLLDHPAVLQLFPARVPGLKPVSTKGVHYFDTGFEHGEAWYRSFFPTSLTRRVHERRVRGRVVAGEASPFYLFHPLAAARAGACVPEAKIIALLRDPVHRTYSHWKERRREGAETLGFLDALDAEPARLAGERERLIADPEYRSYAWEQQSYAAQSRYADSLKPWLAAFPAEQVHVALSEDYYRAPLAVLRELDVFLGLKPRGHASGRVRNPAAGDPLTDEARARLAAHFSGPNDELEKLLGRPLPWI